MYFLLLMPDYKIAINTLFIAQSHYLPFPGVHCQLNNKVVSNFIVVSSSLPAT
jgi:hypothetical protein